MTAIATKLPPAADYARKLIRARVTPTAIIAGLVAHHGACHRAVRAGSRLDCAGVSASCDTGTEGILLQRWSDAAEARLCNREDVA